MASEPSTVSRSVFAAAILKGIAAPVSGEPLLAMVCWMHSEGSKAAWNPLATAMAWPGATIFNDHGVKHYRTQGDGLGATLKALNLSRYDTVRAAFTRAGATAEEIASVVGKTPWGTTEALFTAVVASARNGSFKKYADAKIYRLSGTVDQPPVGTPTKEDLSMSRAIIPARAKLKNGRWPFVALAPGNDAVHGWNGQALKNSKAAYGVNVVMLPAAVRGRKTLSLLEAPDELAVVVVDQTDGGTFVYPYK
jgi:hypothetical protein